jgi:hypothetical protein
MRLRVVGSEAYGRRVREVIEFIMLGIAYVPAARSNQCQEWSSGPILKLPVLVKAGAVPR